MVLDPHRINLGVNINPNIIELEEILKAAKIADSNSIDIIGIQDHPYIGFFFDTWTLISFLASLTSKVSFMTKRASLAPSRDWVKFLNSLNYINMKRVPIWGNQKYIPESLRSKRRGNSW